MISTILANMVIICYKGVLHKSEVLEPFKNFKNPIEKGGRFDKPAPTTQTLVNSAVQFQKHFINSCNREGSQSPGELVC